MKFIVFLLVFVLCGCTTADTYVEEGTASVEEETKEVIPKENIENLPTARQNWGMKRNPPSRPEFTQEQMGIMEKYGCIYMGSNEEKYLYLTFDEGYENGQTGKILDTLKEKGVPAAFFITGDYFKSEKELVDRMVGEGHIVGNHTMEHPCLAKIKDEKELEQEVLSLDLAFYNAYNKHMKYLRPPEGAYSEKSLAVTKNVGYTNVFWSFAYDDWDTKRQKGKEYAIKKVTDNLHPGCVILLHAVSESNAEALGEIIDTARVMGYEFKSLDVYIP